VKAQIRGGWNCFNPINASVWHGGRKSVMPPKKDLHIDETMKLGIEVFALDKVKCSIIVLGGRKGSEGNIHIPI
jgi:hypothetical protein